LDSARNDPWKKSGAIDRHFQRSLKREKIIEFEPPQSWSDSPMARATLSVLQFPFPPPRAPRPEKVQNHQPFNKESPSSESKKKLGFCDEKRRKKRVEIDLYGWLWSQWGWKKVEIQWRNPPPPPQMAASSWPRSQASASLLRGSKTPLTARLFLVGTAQDWTLISLIRNLLGGNFKGTSIHQRLSGN